MIDRTKPLTYLIHPRDKLLYYLDKAGVSSISDITTNVLISDSQVTITIKKLLKLGLVITYKEKGNRYADITLKGKQVIQDRLKSPFTNTPSVEHILLLAQKQGNFFNLAYLQKGLYDPKQYTEKNVLKIKNRCGYMASKNYLLKKPFSNEYCITRLGKEKSNYIQDHKQIYKNRKVTLLISKFTRNNNKNRVNTINYLETKQAKLFKLFNSLTSNRKQKPYYVN